MPSHRHERRLRQLAERTTPRDPDLSLSFLRQTFKKEIDRPLKQLGELASIWDQLVPPELADHARLESLSRGVLRVAVDSSACLYELDRLLRSGLQTQLITRCKGPALRRVLLRVSADWNV
ncbi:MAG: DUF721 domain-containing protein [Phycisphaeraceae bacterium]|nr:DUF721 domain-containing protein [Phycisphaeraceae bacterium]